MCMYLCLTQYNTTRLDWTGLLIQWIDPVPDHSIFRHPSMIAGAEAREHHYGAERSMGGGRGPSQNYTN